MFISALEEHRKILFNIDNNWGYLRAWILVPFTMLVGSSRILLGLHYPSDVLVATLIGLALAFTGILMVA